MVPNDGNTATDAVMADVAPATNEQDTPIEGDNGDARREAKSGDSVVKGVEQTALQEAVIMAQDSAGKLKATEKGMEAAKIDQVAKTCEEMMNGSKEVPELEGAVVQTQGVIDTLRESSDPEVQPLEALVLKIQEAVDCTGEGAVANPVDDNGGDDVCKKQAETGAEIADASEGGALTGEAGKSTAGEAPKSTAGEAPSAGKSAEDSPEKAMAKPEQGGPAAARGAAAKKEFCKWTGQAGACPMIAVAEEMTEGTPKPEPKFKPEDCDPRTLSLAQA